MDRAYDVLSDYFNRGFKVIELSGKEPISKAWQSPLDAGVNYVRTGYNIGIVLGDQSGGLVDIDCDHEISIFMAKQLLPSTEMVFGRLTKPSSHYIYIALDAGRTMQFKLPDGTMLVEYRANGSQTRFPGSMADSGELVEFTKSGEPAEVVAGDLRKATIDVAIATALALDWNEGSRHDKTLAIAGVLRKAGIGQGQASRLIQAVCTYARDNEADDRQAAVGTTYGKRIEEVSGQAKLAEAVGEPLAKQIASWLKKVYASSSMDREERIPSVRNASSVQSEADHAEAFADHYRGSVIYTPQNDQWYRLSNGIFRPVYHSDVQGLVVEHVSSAETMFDSRDMRAAKSTSRTNGVIQLSRYKLTEDLDSLDANRDAVGCMNGVIDLTTGQLSSETHLITKRLAVEFDEDAKCPAFMGFMDEIFMADQEVISFVQRAAGYCLSGHVSENCLFVFLGNGANGKSTLLEVLGGIFGDYDGVTPMQTLMVSKYGQERTDDLANMVGKRLIRAAEGEASAKLATAKIKMMSGGDSITCRLLYKNQITYRPQFKLFISTNDLPVIDEGGDAIWRRIHVVRFPYSVPPDKRDGNLGRKLRAEGPGILNWLLKGYAEFKRQGLNPPDAVKMETGQYRDDSDTVKSFLEERCVRDQQNFHQTTELHSHYQSFCSQSGKEHLPLQKFGKELKRLELEPKKTKKANGWVGYRIIPLESFNLGKFE